MNIPANIRINVSFPFPAVVNGQGPVAIGKTNGIWNITLNFMQLAQQTPLPASWPTDYIVVWDDTAKTFFRMSLADLSALFGGGGGGGSVRHQRLVTTSPIVVASNDEIINCNIAGAAACTLPGFAGRVGKAVTFKDLGQASAHPITISAAPGESIDNVASITLNNNRQGVTFVPANDGFSQGWMIE